MRKHLEGVPGDTVEIGSYKGRSASYLILGCLHNKSYNMGDVPPCVYLIDDFRDYEGSKEEKEKDLKDNLNCYPFNLISVDIVNGDSNNEGFTEWTKRSDESISFLFIDGSHDRASLTRDLRVWPDFIPIGGILTIHDYLNGQKKDVRLTVNDWLNGAPFRPLFTIGTTIYLLRMYG
jgi:hypothetical protein